LEEDEFRDSGVGENTNAELRCNPSRADDLRMTLVAAAVLIALGCSSVVSATARVAAVAKSAQKHEM